MFATASRRFAVKAAAVVATAAAGAFLTPAFAAAADGAPAEGPQFHANEAFAVDACSLLTADSDAVPGDLGAGSASQPLSGYGSGDYSACTWTSVDDDPTAGLNWSGGLGVRLFVLDADVFGADLDQAIASGSLTSRPLDELWLYVKSPAALPPLELEAYYGADERPNGLTVRSDDFIVVCELQHTAVDSGELQSLSICAPVLNEALWAMTSQGLAGIAS